MPDGMEELPYSRKELLGLAEAADIEVLKLDSTGTLLGDFDDWIGGNLRSASRKLSGWPRRPVLPPPTLPSPVELADPGTVRRSYANRRLTYSWLLVGTKKS
jgi:hypothetical protein